MYSFFSILPISKKNLECKIKHRRKKDGCTRSATKVAVPERAKAVHITLPYSLSLVIQK